jgi:transcriptional regulator with XRE-family HTH domain
LTFNPRNTYIVCGIVVSFGEKIRDLRKKLGLSQRDLADRVGIDFTYLSKIENNRADPPSEEVIKKLAKELGTDSDELVVLAGKIPSDLARVLAQHPEQLRFLRQFATGRGSQRRKAVKRPSEDSESEG